MKFDLKFFGTKKTEKKELVQENISKPSPQSLRYFEVFGDTVRQLEWLKLLSIILGFVCVFELILLKIALDKEPIVIKVDALGKASAVDLESDAKLSNIEISNFVYHFLEAFTEWNVYTFQTDFRKAFKMMTLELRPKLNSYVNGGIEDQIKKDFIKTELNISGIVVVKDSPKFIVLKVKGTRQLSSYNIPDYQKQVIFEDDLTLKKVERTADTPWGLLVENWEESLF